MFYGKSYIDHCYIVLSWDPRVGFRLDFLCYQNIELVYLSKVLCSNLFVSIPGASEKKLQKAMDMFIAEI